VAKVFGINITAEKDKCILILSDSGLGFTSGDFFSSNKSSGVDVSITIFCDFPQFLGKKLAIFFNTNVMIKLFQNLALF
jgi:hypothetical protein